MYPVAPQIVAPGIGYHQPRQVDPPASRSSRSSSATASARSDTSSTWEISASLTVSVRQGVDRPDERRHQDAGLTNVWIGDSAPMTSISARVDAELLLRLAERRREELVVARVLEAAGERDLAGVSRHGCGALREHQRRLVADEQREDRGEPVPSGGARPGVVLQVRREGGGEIGHASIVRSGRRMPDQLGSVARCDPMAPRAATRLPAAVDPDEVLELARALIAARSENPGGTEDEAAQVAATFLTGIGASPTIVRGEAGRPSVVATMGGAGGPSLAWNGHLDTVPAGSLDTWSAIPFAGEVVDGRLIGRGACDMKGPIAAALAAGAAVHRAGIELGGSVTFHLAADEELAGVHGTRCLRDRGLLDAGRARSSASPRTSRWDSPSAAAPGSRPPRSARRPTVRSRTAA